ncbi:Uncharacterised protein [Mycobacteroides abscessus subsp. abscessus]|nr:Uncharacterised protein [Mycobacteroides abscessus subsp. abscessus]
MVAAAPIASPTTTKAGIVASSHSALTGRPRAAMLTTASTKPEMTPAS